MKSMAKWMLGAAVVAGGLGLAATPANAAQWGVYIGEQSNYVPPCPGPGYEWVAGYYGDGYWVPGRWAYVGVRYPAVRYYGERDRHDYYRDRDDWREGRHWEHERHEWRDHRDHDHRWR